MIHLISREIPPCLSKSLAIPVSFMCLAKSNHKAPPSSRQSKRRRASESENYDISKKEKEEGKESIKHDQPGDAPAQASESALLGEEINAKQEAPIREKPAVIEERSGLIQFRVVTNDNKPDSLVILTGLKHIFMKQLPKMPREYITRLVMDRHHWSMAIVKRGLQAVSYTHLTLPTTPYV